MAGFSEELNRLESIQRVVDTTEPHESPFAYFNMGKSRYDATDYSGAIRLWKRLLEGPLAEKVDPALLSHTLFSLGRALDAAGDLAGALEAYEGFASRHPLDALARFNAGEILSRLERFGEAEAHYLAAAELDVDPDAATRRDALVNLSGDRQSRGNVAGSLELLREVRDIDPDDGEIRLALATALRDVGDVGAAFAEATRAVELLETHDPDPDADALRRDELARGLALVEDLTAERAGRNPAPP